MAEPAGRSQQPAGGAVLLCQAGPDGKSKTFCDVDRIELMVVVKDGPTRTVSNTKRTAIEAGAGPLVPNTEAFGWLTRYAAVIALETDFTEQAVGGASGRGLVEGRNVASKKVVAASVKTSAGERCDLHPAVTPYSETETARRGFGSMELDLSISSVSFDYTEFFSRLWKWSGFSELFSPSTAEKEFVVAGCAAPSSGRARGSFKALARVTARDEWRIEYSTPTGFALKLGRSQSATAYLDGARERSKSTKLEGRLYGDTASYSSASTSYSRGGSTASSSSTTVKGEFSDATSTTKARIEHKQASLSAVGDIDKGAGRRFEKAVEGMEPETPGKLAKVGSWLSSKTGDGAHTLSVVRNGNSLSTADIDGMVRRVTSIVEAGSDTLEMLSRIFVTGMKSAAPATLTTSIGFDIALLQGGVTFRHWRVPTAPLSGPAHYIETSDGRWTLGLNLTVASGSLTAGIEGQVKFVAAWIASGTLSLEAKCKGSGKIAFDVGKGQSPASFSGHGWYGITIAATGDITVAAYYATLSAEVAGGVRYLYEADFDSLDLKPKRSRLRSERTTLTIKVMRGNKLREFFGFGEATTAYKWPSDGPLILLEDDQFVKDFV